MSGSNALVKWNDPLHADTYDTRFIDWAKRLGVDDDIRSIDSMTLTRICDPAQAIDPAVDLQLVTAPERSDPWIGPNDDREDCVVNYWIKSGDVPEDRSYVITMTVTTAVGRVLTSDVYQSVVLKMS